MEIIFKLFGEKAKKVMNLVSERKEIKWRFESVKGRDVAIAYLD